MTREKQKKPIFKKWWFWLIAIIIIGVAMNGGEDPTSDNSGKDNKASESSSSEKTSEEKKETEKTYKIGDVVSIGDMQYTVNNVEQASKVGNSSFPIEANGVFVIIDLTVKNNGNESAMVTSSFFKLKSGEKIFDADSTAMIYANQEGNNSLFLDNLNPDVEMSGKVVFDVSQETADSDTLVLQAQTGYWGTETVEIKLTK